MPEPIFVPLDKPPQPITLTVRALLQRVASGGVRVPAFQRPLRWDAENVVSLFDSIYRGYPVGSLLFWKKEAAANPEYKIGDAFLPVPENREAWFIVDGQQRVTALAAALMDLPRTGESRWAVRFDPRNQVFLSGPVSQEEVGRVVPLSVLGDLRRLGRWFRDSSLDDAQQTILEEVQQRLLDYELSAYLMETNEPAALRGVFARLNSTGVRMRSDEVFQALLGESESQHQGLDLNRLQKACDLDGFGQPPRGEIMKAVLAMSRQDPTRRIESLSADDVVQLVSFDAAQAALERAVNFLQAPPDAVQPGAGIPCYAFVPYPVVFVLLARWFFRFPDAESGVLRDLSHWLWRGVIHATHQRAAVSALRLQVRLIDGDNPAAAVDALLRVVGEPERVDWKLESFHAGNARSRVEILALLSKGPRDPRGPVSWRSLVSSGDRVAREIIASPGWKKFNKEEGLLAKGAANRALLDARETGLRAAFKTWDVHADRESLESHLIDPNLWTKLDSDPVGFLRGRAAQVQALVSAFLAQRAGLGLPRLRLPESYLDMEPDLDESMPTGGADDGF